MSQPLHSRERCTSPQALPPYKSGPQAGCVPLPALPAAQTGTTLHRQSRRVHPPKRPEGGWSLLVTPLGKAARAGERQAYVAQPDGTQRPLTADERLNLERQQPLPRHSVA